MTSPGPSEETSQSDGTAELSVSAPAHFTSFGRPSIKSWRRKVRAARGMIGSVTNNIGEWGVAVLWTVLIPCAPVFIEWWRTGEAKPDSIYITTWILSVGFAVTTKNALLKLCYFSLVVCSALPEFVRGPYSAMMDASAIWMLVATCVAQAGQLFDRHIGLDKPFSESN